MNDGLAIQQINKMNSALAEIATLHDALDFVDKAKAVKILLDAAGLGEYAREVKVSQLRAERLAGRFIADMPKAQGTRGAGRPSLGGNIVLPPKDEAPTYDDLGITKMQASRWQQVASLPDADFEQIVASTKQSGRELTQSAVLRAARAATNEAKTPAPFPVGKYGVIYADPPWSYSNSGFEQSAAAIYPTMALDEICALPVRDMAAETSVLFLWATSPLLDEAFEVIVEWGFVYKACRVWVKNRAPGMGWWGRTKHELLLIASRGTGAHPAVKLDSVFNADVGAHSKKPDLVYNDIEACYPGATRIELFARGAREGWEAWGNENI